MSPKVLFILLQPLRYTYPQPSRFLNLSKNLNDRGITSKIIAIRSRENLNQLDTDFVEEKYKLPFIRKIYLIFSLCKKLISNRSAEFFYFRENFYSIIFILLSKILGSKLIYEHHGFEYKTQTLKEKHFRSKLTKSLEYLSLEKSNIIITVSEELRLGELSDLSNKKKYVLPNGVDISKFTNRRSILSASKLHFIVFTGKFFSGAYSEKDLLEFPKYCKANVKLVIAASLRKVKDYKNQFPYILFTGLLSQKEIINLLYKASIGLLPYNDTMKFTRSPRKSQEYLAAGLPIICSNVETGRESFLVPDKNFLAYEYGNPRDLASKVDFLIGNKKMREEMSINNLNLSKDLSWQNQINRSDIISILRTRE